MRGGGVEVTGDDGNAVDAVVTLVEVRMKGKLVDGRVVGDL